MNGGTEWIVDAHGCDPARLRDREAVRALLDRVVAELALGVVGQPLVHAFDAPGGVTALYLLTESHLCCHTYPESGVATFNLYCCRERPAWPWAAALADALGASRVEVRRERRGGAP
ncbi:MAG TPA: S-adenosylmethionine decarboxylase [Kofleriaceae bacterium]|nr:S-adenosylmethionine decarboxylase [Kofleriaceae bacterium]